MKKPELLAPAGDLERLKIALLRHLPVSEDVSMVLWPGDVRVIVLRQGFIQIRKSAGSFRKMLKI